MLFERFDLLCRNTYIAIPLHVILWYAEVIGVEFADILETVRGFSKMGFGVGRTNLDLMRVAADSYVSMYEFYIKQMVPSESFESIRKVLSLYSESQNKVFDNFKKLLDQLEKQQDEMFSRLLDITKPKEEKKK